MRGFSNNIRTLALTGIVWPAVITLAAFTWPGPQAPPEFVVHNSVASEPTVVPPVDSGTQLALNRNGSARIFWEIPEDGVVQLTIEIDGNNSGDRPSPGVGESPRAGSAETAPDDTPQPGEDQVNPGVE